MKTLGSIVMLVALLGLFATMACAEFHDASVIGRGLTRIAVPRGASTYLGNPAGLPKLVGDGLPLSPWVNRASASTTLESEVDRYSVHYSGRTRTGTFGCGGGLWHAEFDHSDADYFGLGVGADISRWLCPNLSIGLNLVNQSTDEGDEISPDQLGDDDQTMFNIGLMKQFELPANTCTVGLLARDITDEFDNGVMFDVGAAVEMPTGLLVAADLNDVTDEVDTTFNIGAEWPIPMTDFTVRAGLADGDLTVGAGYTVLGSWELSAAWADYDWDEETVVSVTGVF